MKKVYLQPNVEVEACLEGMASLMKNSPQENPVLDENDPLINTGGGSAPRRNVF